MAEGIAAKEAAHGEKMIELKVRFWTNDITEKGSIVPKHGWGSGVVRIERNRAHGIVPTNPVPFNSLLDIGRAIEKCLINNGITLYESRRERKYRGRA